MSEKPSNPAYNVKVQEMKQQPNFSTSETVPQNTKSQSTSHQVKMSVIPDIEPAKPVVKNQASIRQVQQALKQELKKYEKKASILKEELTSSSVAHLRSSSDEDTRRNYKQSNPQSVNWPRRGRTAVNSASGANLEPVAPRRDKLPDSLKSTTQMFSNVNNASSTGYEHKADSCIVDMTRPDQVKRPRDASIGGQSLQVGDGDRKRSRFDVGNSQSSPDQSLQRFRRNGSGDAFYQNQSNSSFEMDASKSGLTMPSGPRVDYRKHSDAPKGSRFGNPSNKEPRSRFEKDNPPDFNLPNTPRFGRDSGHHSRSVHFDFGPTPSFGTGKQNPNGANSGAQSNSGGKVNSRDVGWKNASQPTMRMPGSSNKSSGSFYGDSRKSSGLSQISDHNPAKSDPFSSSNANTLEDTMAIGDFFDISTITSHSSGNNDPKLCEVILSNVSIIF